MEVETMPDSATGLESGKQQTENGVLLLLNGRIKLRAPGDPIVPAGDAPDPEMVQINAMTRRVLDPAEVYRFDLYPSTDRLDSYYTRMGMSSLRNYAAEASVGVALMNSHRTSMWLSLIHISEP